MDCYTATLGDCSGGTSTEHYISRSVLQLVGTAVRVSDSLGKLKAHDRISASPHWAPTFSADATTNSFLPWMRRGGRLLALSRAPLIMSFEAMTFRMGQPQSTETV